MDKRENCKVVQDLLPNYIEKLTSEETNGYIEKHLEECDDCKKVYSSMLEDLKVDDCQKEKRKVNYMKKFSQKMRILKIILLLIVVIFLVVITRRAIILTNLANKSQRTLEQGSENFYYKLESLSDGNFKVWETYYKDGTTILKITTYSLEQKEKQETLYQNGDEKFRLIQEDGINKLYNIGGISITPITVTSDIIFENWFTAIFSTIQKVNLNGKTCYIIKDKNTEKFIDADTGVAIKIIDNELNQTTDYTYVAGNVSDEDITKPDISSYDIIN